MRNKITWGMNLQNKLRTCIALKQNGSLVTQSTSSRWKVKRKEWHPFGGKHLHKHKRRNLLIVHQIVTESFLV